MRLGEVRPQLDRLAVRGDRRVRLPLTGQCVAEAVMGVGEARPKPDRRAERDNRRVQLPLTGQRVAEVVMGLGEVCLLYTSPSPRD